MSRLVLRRCVARSRISRDEFLVRWEINALVIEMTKFFRDLNICNKLVTIALFMARAMLLYPLHRDTHRSPAIAVAAPDGAMNCYCEPELVARGAPSLCTARWPPPRFAPST